MLMERLGLLFSCEIPSIDESQVTDETPEQLVQRLAQAKASRIAGNHEDAIVIGSDQVATLNNEILLKPGSHDKAKAQLERLSNQCVRFITGLCVINTLTQTTQLDFIPYLVRFRSLDNHEIERYLQKEQPYDCAGSFKSEGLGVSLLARMEGDDPTALIGLPLIRLSEMLRQEGIALP